MEQFYTIFDDDNHRMGFVEPMVYEQDMLAIYIAAGLGIVLLIVGFVWLNKYQAKKAEANRI